MAKVIHDSEVLITLMSKDDSHHGLARTAVSAEHLYSISAVTLSKALIALFRVGANVVQDFRLMIRRSMNQIFEINEEMATLAAQKRAEKKLNCHMRLSVQLLVESMLNFGPLIAPKLMDIKAHSSFPESLDPVCLLMKNNALAHQFVSGLLYIQK